MSGPLNHSPARIVAQAIADLSLASFNATTWGLYVGMLPDTPDEAICVFNTTGVIQGRIQFTGETIEMHGVQVRIRGRYEEKTYAKARAIAVALDTQIRRTLVTIGSDTYRIFSFNRTSSVIPLGADSPTTKRRSFAVNGIVSVRAVPGTGT